MRLINLELSDFRAVQKANIEFKGKSAVLFGIMVLENQRFYVR